MDLKTLNFNIDDPSFIFFFLLFFWPLLIEEAQDMTGNRIREGGSDTQQIVPWPGFEPGATAARTKPLHMGHPLYQLTYTAPFSFPI